MFLDGALDHLALDCQRLDVSVGLSDMQKRFAPGIAQLNEFCTLGHANLAYSEILIHGALGCHFQKISVFYGDFPAYDTGACLHI